MAKATMQLQKTRMAKPQTKTTISQKQSLELVQTMLHSGLSSLSFLRAFFPESAFDSGVYKASSRIPSYKSYADAAAGEESSQDGIKLKVLRRGRSRRVDTFLDWLEKGVFSALKQGVLRSMEIHVHPDEAQRQKVIEKYTFTIRYHSRGQGAISGIELDSPGKMGIAAETSSQALKTFLHDVMQMCGYLSDLPDARHISMILHYTDDQDKLRFQGFVPRSATKVQLAFADGWKRCTEGPGSVESSFHSASMEVSTLAEPTAVAMQGLAGPPPPAMPKRLEYSIVEDDVAHEISHEDSASPPPGGLRPSEPAQTPSTVVPGDDDQQDAASFHLGNKESADDREQSLAVRETPFPQPSHSTADNMDTQTSNVPRMRSALQSMMLPEHLTQGDTQTQAFLMSSTGDSVQTPPSSKRHAVGLASSAVGMDISRRSTHHTYKVTLLPDVASQREANKKELRQNAQKLSKASINRFKQTDVVLCQCRQNVDDGEMLQCTYCGTCQHLHCYGYTGVEDHRLPSNHACYHCLIGDDQAVLDQMKELVQSRRFMISILENGAQANVNKMASALGFDAANTKKVHAFLIREKFVLQTSAPKTRSRSTALAQLKPPEDDAVWHKLVELLFNPLTHIEKYYAELVTDFNAAEQQLRALVSSSNQPQAPTPARRSRQSMTKTPGSALDIRASLGRYQTPVLKRGLVDDIFQVPAKRQATASPVHHRLKSVQTELALNADGHSSPGQ